jgi:hypothetical protein
LLTPTPIAPPIPPRPNLAANRLTRKACNPLYTSMRPGRCAIYPCSRPTHRWGATLPESAASLPLPPGQFPAPRTPAASKSRAASAAPPTLPHHVVPSPCPPSLPFLLPSLGTRSGLIPTPCVCGGLLSPRVLRMPVPPNFFGTPRLFALRKKAGTHRKKPALPWEWPPLAL